LNTCESALTNLGPIPIIDDKYKFSIKSWHAENDAITLIFTQMGAIEKIYVILPNLRVIYLPEI